MVAVRALLITFKRMRVLMDILSFVMNIGTNIEISTGSWIVFQTNKAGSPSNLLCCGVTSAFSSRLPCFKLGIIVV